MAIVDPTHWFLDAQEMPRSPGFTRGNLAVPLIDGKAYFGDLQAFLASADSQVLLAGWEFNIDAILDPHVANGAIAGESLGEAVRKAAQRGCDVRSLIFSVPTSALPGRFQHLQAPSNIAFARAVNGVGGEAILDDRLARTPTISAHHQKLVLVAAKDPARTAAWVGGMDLTFDRWDTPAHNSPPERQKAMVAAWHDVQVRVQGPAVSQLWHGFRGRWNDPRPPNHMPTLEEFRGRSRMNGAPPNVREASGTHAVQVHQTLPAGVFPDAGGPGENTVEMAHRRAIERAEHYIYIEDQYIWPCSLVEPLEEALVRGLHVVLVIAREDINPVQRATSNRLRYDVIERLRLAGGERFHVFHLEQPSGEHEQIYVHAKLMIVDDCYVSIGSANFNGRSMTNDTELEIGIVDEALVETTIAGKPAQVCRLAHELRCALWAEHFERPAEMLKDPIAAMELLWPIGMMEETRRAQPYHVTIGPLSLEPLSEHITTLIADHLIDVPLVDVPKGTERGAVKLLVDAALRGPARTALMSFVDQTFNPSLAPAFASVSQPFTLAWQRHWARRAAHAVEFLGKRSEVSISDLAGQEFVEQKGGVQIFRLADGRYHVVSHFAVPTLETARSAAMAISGQVD